jgi:hypothetical protein
LKKVTKKLLTPKAGWARPVSALRGSRKADTGLARPALGVKSFCALFSKSAAFFLLHEKLINPR